MFAPNSGKIVNCTRLNLFYTRELRVIRSRKKRSFSNSFRNSLLSLTKSEKHSVFLKQVKSYNSLQVTSIYRVSVTMRSRFSLGSSFLFFFFCHSRLGRDYSGLLTWMTFFHHSHVLNTCRLASTCGMVIFKSARTSIDDVYHVIPDFTPS